VADWYVYQHDGEYLGPWPTDAVAVAILSGKLGADVWVAAPGGQRWQRALDIPVIARLVEGGSVRRKRRDSGLRLMPQALPRAAQSPEDAESAAQTLKMPVIRFAEEEPTPTPPSPHRAGGNDTLESGTRRARRTGG
jgi:hypothetical protein